MSKKIALMLVVFMTASLAAPVAYATQYSPPWGISTPFQWGTS